VTAAIGSDRPIFNIAQAARYLGVGPKVVRRWCKQGKLPHRKIDRRGTIRIHRDTLDDFVRNQPAHS
jgi:excisionase family DNA binding protein